MSWISRSGGRISLKRYSDGTIWWPSDFEERRRLKEALKMERRFAKLSTNLLIELVSDPNCEVRRQALHEMRHRVEMIGYLYEHDVFVKRDVLRELKTYPHGDVTRYKEGQTLSKKQAKRAIVNIRRFVRRRLFEGERDDVLSSDSSDLYHLAWGAYKSGMRGTAEFDSFVREFVNAKFNRNQKELAHERNTDAAFLLMNMKDERYRPRLFVRVMKRLPEHLAINYVGARTDPADLGMHFGLLNCKQISEYVKYRCIKVLCSVAEDNPEMVEPLLYKELRKALARSDGGETHYALFALDRLKSIGVDRDLDDVVIRHLDDADEFVRYRAALLLGKIGKKSHIVEILRCMTDKCRFVRFAAVIALSKMIERNVLGPDAPEVSGTFAVLDEADRGLFRAFLAPQKKFDLSNVNTALECPDTAIRIMTCQGLYQAIEEDEECRKGIYLAKTREFLRMTNSLARIIHDKKEDEILRYFAVVAIAKAYQTRKEGMVPTHLYDALEDSCDFIRYRAAGMIYAVSTSMHTPESLSLEAVKKRRMDVIGITRQERNPSVKRKMLELLKRENIDIDNLPHYLSG